MDQYKQELLQFLSQYISENRLAKIEHIAKERTRYLSIAVEDIYQPHNASAVMRSAECFGIQDVHVIENKNKYKPSKEITKGANNWLTMHHYNAAENNTLDCIRTLKKQGYRVIATTPHEKYSMIDKLDVTKGKMALFFGTELEGISEDVRNEADELVRIPMYGFTESFNISVSAAICLYQLTMRLRDSDIHWQLNEEELLDIKLEWVKNSIQRVELIVQEFQKRRGI
ncbi:MAG TPA: RNA methyltransferase [Bacteroidia bacterium]|nr:RNA methyltransferase [Bacteroidia bacterium]